MYIQIYLKKVGNSVQLPLEFLGDGGALETKGQQSDGSMWGWVF